MPVYFQRKSFIFGEKPTILISHTEIHQPAGSYLSQLSPILQKISHPQCPFQPTHHIFYKSPARRWGEAEGRTWWGQDQLIFVIFKFYFTGQMESRSYMFSTAKKRSTLLENKGIEFPREDNAAPRMLIARKQCPDEYGAFTDCLEANPGKPENCVSFRQALFDCGRIGFKKANSDPDYTY